ncbi:MAG: ABC transporter permease subunit [Candidatus Sumerlaeia bacterium]|nr:ABC transporter permease subunit [Candidatus Sumerlaeia bacterium]
MSPVTRRRVARFRRIKRGYWSFLILTILFVLSLFAELVANNRAIIVYYEGQFFFPTYAQFYEMDVFGQEDEFGFTDVEADYRAMREQFAGTSNWVLMPPIPFNPIEMDFTYDAPPPNPPDGRHILGTDTRGRDVAARLIYGFRICMLFALALTLVTTIVGTIIGCIQGYMSGWFDILSQRVIEVWQSLPFLFIVIVLATVVRPGFWTLLAVMAVFGWMGITYYMRTEMYREKSREYCLAARSLGASNGRIVFLHLLPNALTPLVTFTPFAVVSGIFALTALDFLGYGLQPPTPSWGELLSQALSPGNRRNLWLVLSPFAAISITLILVTLIGEAVREAFDPKQFARYK